MHTHPDGVWLITFKKGTGKPRMEYAVAVEEALCFGWVDSKPGKLDDERSLLWFAPRKKGSGWSRPNKERVERLITEGRMTAAGLAVVETAKADGSWTLLDAVEALEMPEDLVSALESHPQARTNWDDFPPSAKRGILEWIVQAKTAPTRAKRVAETARQAAENKRANQWRP
ncbi:MAG: YdeI/OmpD-associated family protein [Caldilineaceae bacterium]